MEWVPISSNAGDDQPLQLYADGRFSYAPFPVVFEPTSALQSMIIGGVRVDKAFGEGQHLIFHTSPPIIYKYEGGHWYQHATSTVPASVTPIHASPKQDTLGHRNVMIGCWIYVALLLVGLTALVISLSESDEDSSSSVQRGGNINTAIIVNSNTAIIVNSNATSTMNSNSSMMNSNYSSTNAQSSDKPTFETLNPTVSHVKFFRTNYTPTLREARQYATSFSQSGTRYIYWELGLDFTAAPSKRVRYIMKTVWNGPDGRIFHRRTQKLYIEEGWNSLLQSGGLVCKIAGCFSPGVYRVDFFVGRKKIASGSFEITAAD
jgi:hypothetical protein